MIYPVHVYGMPALRRKAEDIDKDYPGLQELIRDMFETMHEADGIGLAAPQIGKSIRLIVVDATEVESDEEDLSDFKKAFINARILEESGKKWAFSEGCLSIPAIREEVNRKPRVRIQYYDPEWNFHDEVMEGIPARILQHEVDHLEGILFTDHLAPLKKRLLNGKLRDISKGKVDISYKIQFPKK